MNDDAEIKKFFRGEADKNEATLEANSRDASLFRLQPSLVVFPRDREDLKNLVKYVAGQKRGGRRDISLTARAAGTDMSGGPLSISIVVSYTRHLNRLIEISDDYAIVEPGMYYRDFERETLQHGLLLPSYPASRELCALGGMVANNSGGEKTLRYGKTERYIEEIKMILDNGEEYTFGHLSPAELEAKKQLSGREGEIYRQIAALIEANFGALQAAKPAVTKNSAGYYLWNVWDEKRQTFNLAKLIVGSQGTLGLMTEIKLKLIKPEPCTSMAVIFLPKIAPVAEVALRVLRFGPDSLESYDDKTLKLAIKLLPELIKKLRGNFLQLALAFLPELWSATTGGLPKLVLLAEFSGATLAEALGKATAAAAAVQDIAGLRVKIAKDAAAAAKYWVMRRESFNLLRHHVKNLRTAPFIDDFVVRPEFLPEFLPRLYRLLDRYHNQMIYTIAGHVGDGNFHIIPLMDLGRPESAEIIKQLSQQVYDLVLTYHGSITGEHNDGLIRGPFLRQAFGDKIYALFETTKKIFDPLNIFNPGKKVGASLDYALAHLDAPHALKQNNY